MDKVEIVRVALAELGDLSSAEIVAFAQERFGVQLEAKFVPILRATLCDRERMAAAREVRAAQARVSAVTAESAVGEPLRPDSASALPGSGQSEPPACCPARA